MARKRLETLSEVHELSNRDLLVEIVCKLHEMDGKLNTHLAIHAFTVKIAGGAVAVAGLVLTAIKLWY